MGIENYKIAGRALENEFREKIIEKKGAEKVRNAAILVGSFGAVGHAGEFITYKWLTIGSGVAALGGEIWRRKGSKKRKETNVVILPVKKEEGEQYGEQVS